MARRNSIRVDRSECPQQAPKITPTDVIGKKRALGGVDLDIFLVASSQRDRIVNKPVTLC